MFDILLLFLEKLIKYLHSYSLDNYPIDNAVILILSTNDTFMNFVGYPFIYGSIIDRIIYIFLVYLY